MSVHSTAIPLPGLRTGDGPPADPDYAGDLTLLARHLTPTEAHMLCARLQACGIPAEACDTNTVQTHSLLAPALGGASLRVPERYVDEARALMAALERGDFALDEDFGADPDAELDPDPEA